MRTFIAELLASAPRGTQSRLADALGVRPTTVNKWALGYNAPDPDRWLAIEEFFGLDPGTIARAGGAAPRDELAERVTRLEIQLRDLALAVHRLAGELDADDEPSLDAIPDGPASGTVRR